MYGAVGESCLIKVNKEAFVSISSYINGDHLLPMTP